MPFTIHVTKDFDQMSQVAAELVEASIDHRLAEADSFVLGLATGSSPTGETVIRRCEKSTPQSDVKVSVAPIVPS